MSPPRHWAQGQEKRPAMRPIASRAESISAETSPKPFFVHLNSVEGADVTGGLNFCKSKFARTFVMLSSVRGRDSSHLQPAEFACGLEAEWENRLRDLAAAENELRRREQYQARRPSYG